MLTFVGQGVLRCSRNSGFVGSGTKRPSKTKSQLFSARNTRNVNCRNVWKCTVAAEKAVGCVGSLAVRRWYRTEPVPWSTQQLVQTLGLKDAVLTFEFCYYVGYDPNDPPSVEVLSWLLGETFEPELLRPQSSFSIGKSDCSVVEVGPRLNFQTAWSTNAVGICQACGLSGVHRLERSRRYRIQSSTSLSEALISQFLGSVHDRMTETVYGSPLESFDYGIRPAVSSIIPLQEHGRPALEECSISLGLGFDESDLDLYMDLFTNQMKRNPTDVELFDLAQSNSEHSRHWFFNGNIVVDGVLAEKNLFDMVRDTLRANPRNSVVAFSDNSSTIRGFPVPVLKPAVPGRPSMMGIATVDRDILFTAETHNFPSGVAPFPGAETGTGGRIRDTAATGIGSLVVGGTTGYSVGNLRLPGVEAPWEDPSFSYPSNMASPLKILIQASNGASDYGNKFGEPVINGFARTYGQRLSTGDRLEYVKPIMFSGGMGQMDHAHAEKGVASQGLLVVKLGGPAYRIGLGGGAASSMIQGDNSEELDFGAVQRGDAEMASKACRVLRACVELGNENPIVSLHDQGAGGNCNVVKELIYPSGGRIELRNIAVGDASLSALEIWGAEYQEQFGLLLKPESADYFMDICSRECVVATVIGTTDDSGRIDLWDANESKSVVDLDLEAVLGDLPQKTFVDSRVKDSLAPLDIPGDLSVRDALRMVLSLMTVSSKRFLTTKVDRSVTGLVAQQQCVGPLQVPLADCGVLAQSMFGLTGSATALGERPTMVAISPAAMARMSVGEMMTNLAGAAITHREDIKCEGNWMWAAKLPGQGAALYDAVDAVRASMIALGIAIDGGKDSLSMAARTDEELVKAPGTLVVSGYATVEDVNAKLTPDLKSPSSTVLHVDLAGGKKRLGGSALAQVLSQVGNSCPDVEDTGKLGAAFDVVQGLIAKNSGVLSYHDVSDGGLLVSVLEMAFAGNRGLDVTIPSSADREELFGAVFAEELGMLLEVDETSVADVQGAFAAIEVPCSVLASTRADRSVSVQVKSGEAIVESDIGTLRAEWEKTSFAVDRLQSNPVTVEDEESRMPGRSGLSFVVPFEPKPTDAASVSTAHKVAIIREEGSNGDREMSAAFHLAGFESWDVSMKDIASGAVTLSDFRGIAFVGGFSYADVLDSAKGWAGVMRYNAAVRAEFDRFYARTDTFSLGVCNGCQVMALLGVVPYSDTDLAQTSQPRFLHNTSGRYESRFTQVGIQGSPAVMLRGMAGARLGIWVSHGEGRAHFPDAAVLNDVLARDLAPLRYVDDGGDVAASYPENPNGSTHGIAALCSADGRHLALMPHPERTVLPWQWAYLPGDEAKEWEVSPWLRLFQNAREWCDETAE